MLVMAGKLRRKSPDSPEDELLIRAMRDSNVPKFLEQDLPLFEGIITDLFPTSSKPNIDNARLEAAIRTQLDKEKYIYVEKFKDKIIQLLETMTVRHGNMLVGSTGTGRGDNLRPNPQSRNFPRSCECCLVVPRVFVDFAWNKPV